MINLDEKAKEIRESVFSTIIPGSSRNTSCHLL
jgi:hypothetical protein